MARGPRIHFSGAFCHVIACKTQVRRYTFFAVVGYYNFTQYDPGGKTVSQRHYYGLPVVGEGLREENMPTNMRIATFNLENLDNKPRQTPTRRSALL
jgi:hypothetical protein